MGEFVRLEVDEASRVATIRLDRPPVNALNAQVQHELREAAGQAAADGRVGAVVLAKCLRDLPDVPQALAAYERLRRRRVERIVTQGARTSRSKTQGPVGRALSGIMLPLVLKFLVTERSQAWIYGHHLDWDAPVAPAAQAA